MRSKIFIYGVWRGYVLFRLYGSFRRGRREREEGSTDLGFGFIRGRGWCLGFFGFVFYW